MAKFNICLIKPDGYDHSYVFSELADLLCFSLKDLGHDATIKFNNIDLDAKNILIGCHLLYTNFIPEMPKNCIVLNTEQIYIDENNWHENVFAWAKSFEVWDYSPRNIEKFKSIGITNVKLLKLGYQKELVRLNNDVPKEFDVLFYGSVNDRRKVIFEDLETKGLKFGFLFGVYGRERDAWIEKSKVVLNMHHYDSQIFEIVRVFYLMTNSVAVVGEVNDTTSIDDMYRRGILEAKYEELVDRCAELVGNEDMQKQLRKQAFDTISQYPQYLFTKEVL